MTGRTHLLLGLACGVVIAAHAPYTAPIRAGIVALAGIASLLPDVDHPRAIISGWLPGIGHAVRMFASHRTWTHSLIFLIVLAAGAWAIGGYQYPLIVGALALAMVSHLVADMCTPAGVPLLLPLSRRSWRIAPYPVLSATSPFLEALAMVGSVGVVGLVLLGKL
jgi:inner membrane protein